MRRGPVHRRVAVEVQLVAVPGAHVRPPLVRRRSSRRRGGVRRGQAAGEREHDDAADDAGDAPGEPVVVDALGAVAGERAVVGAWSSRCSAKPWSSATRFSPSGRPEA